ncbi:hypothetical protein CANINC_004902 [Pichia inconspicua]|uniref:Uncharacterized protein n=1 Tax=Pichia inconspicua TaxID=52247 RepID=A0A4T0WV28_9ASCO|nr:hypothetical protein CANINC_004902 [[Candida] inconspicua]
MADLSLRIRDAIREDNYFIVSKMLENDISLLDNIDPSNGWSNLHYAAYYDHYQIAELLLNEIHKRFIQSITETQGRNFSNNLKAPDSDLYMQLTDEDEIKLTFEKQTVLHIACQGNATATLKLLLQFFNVCLDQRDLKGLTPTHICCINGFSECLLILLKNNAYVNIQDNDGDTPLHKAFQFAHLNCLEILIKYDADDTLINNVGWNPIDVAFDSELINTYKLLKSKPSQIHLPNIDNIKIPQSKFGPPISTRSPTGSLYSQSINSLNLENSNRINLPSIIPRKLSLSSMLSEDYMDKFEFNNDNKSSTGSRKTSKNSSPCASVSNLSLSSRKNTVGSIQDSQSSRRIPQQINNNTQLSPRKSVGSIYPTINESPNSKKSNLSSRTFRSNSQTSEPSPIKTDSNNSQSRPQTPKYLNLTYRAQSSSVSSQVEEASSKLHDFKLKNNDRLKLDTKLGNSLSNTSQEHLILSPTISSRREAGSPVTEFETRSIIDTHKRSKILSIPILSSRARHNT